MFESGTHMATVFCAHRTGFWASFSSLAQIPMSDATTSPRASRAKTALSTRPLLTLLEKTFKSISILLTTFSGPTNYTAGSSLLATFASCPFGLLSGVSPGAVCGLLSVLFAPISSTK